MATGRQIIAFRPHLCDINAFDSGLPALNVEREAGQAQDSGNSPSKANFLLSRGGYTQAMLVGNLLLAIIAGSFAAVAAALCGVSFLGVLGTYAVVGTLTLCVVPLLMALATVPFRQEHGSRLPDRSVKSGKITLGSVG